MSVGLVQSFGRESEGEFSQESGEEFVFKTVWSLCTLLHLVFHGLSNGVLQWLISGEVLVWNTVDKRHRVGTRWRFLLNSPISSSNTLLNCPRRVLFRNARNILVMHYAN